MTADHDKYLVPGLMRGLAVLRCFTQGRPRLRLTDIADELNITKSAAFRVVYTLTHLGYLLPDKNTGDYSLGPAVLGLGQGYLANREITEIARPVLERLRNQTGWSAHMGILEGSAVLYVIRIPASSNYSGLVQIGSRLPAHSTTMGRVCLAGKTDKAIRNIYRGEFSARARAHRTMNEILDQAKRDRETEIVCHIGDFESGILALAAPVKDVTGNVVAAINLTMQGHGIEKTKRRSLEKDLSRAAKQISHLLGNKGDADTKPRAG